MVGLALWSGVASAALLRFETRTAWKQPRFYLFGRWDSQGKQIQWSDGRGTLLEPPSCAAARDPLGWSFGSGMETSRSGDWWALRVDPASNSETLNLDWADGCRASVQLNLSWEVTEKNQTLLVPRIVLNALPQAINKLDVSFEVPSEYLNLSALLDLSFGYSGLGLPNSPQNLKGSLVTMSVQTLIQSSFLGGLGASVGMDQGLYSTGANLVISHWNASAHYRVFLAVADGLHLRAGLGLRDQSASAKSRLLSNTLLDSTQLTGLLSADLYWARRWMLGLRAESSIADLSPTDSGKSQVGCGVVVAYRISPALSLFAESRYRSFAEEGLESEILFQYAQLGSRLEF